MNTVVEEEKVDVSEQRDEVDDVITKDSIFDDYDNGEKEDQEEPTNLDEPVTVDEDAQEQPTEFDKVVQELFAQEEQLLSLHMQAIQQNAEYITEENKLMEAVQSSDYDMDAYALRLTEILQHKTEMILSLRGRLEPFRELLRKEEELSKQH